MRSVVVALIAIGCSSSSEPPQDHQPAPAPVATPKPVAAKPSSATKPLVLPPAEPGPVYIGLSPGMAVILPDGTLQEVAIAGYPRGLTTGLDGKVYTVVDGAGDGMALYRLDGATATKLGVVRVTNASGLAIDKAGVVYVAEYENVIKFDGKQSSKLPRPGSQVSALAIDGAGNLIAQGLNGVEVLAGDAWKKLELPESARYLVGQGSQLVIVTSRGSFELVDGTPKKIFDDARPARAPAMTPTGVFVNYAYGPKHAVAHLYDRNGGTATSDRIYGNVVDARGRQWYVADGALVVESLLGGDRSAYPIGSLPALVKAGNAGNGMLVVGGGPSTLPAAGAVATVETVTGKILFGSTPLANAEVEICTSPSFNYQVSPCAGAASRVATTTNAKGELTFTKVPLGLYSLTFKNGPKWGRASDVSVALVKAAPTHALGTLRY